MNVRTTTEAASGGDSAGEPPAGDGSATGQPAGHGSESPARGGNPHAADTGGTGPAGRPRTLSTHAPRVGTLQPLPLPRLSPVDTSLPGVRADAGLLRDRWLGAASLVGQSHLNSGTTAQDAYQFTVSDDGSLLAAVVCDGLGSRALTSQLGASLLSALLCTAARRTTAERLEANPHAVLGDILGEACAQLLRLRAVALPGLTDGDLSSTVAFVLVPADGVGWAVRIGDCAVMTLADGVWGTVFHKEEGPLNRVTAALPHPAPADAAEYAPLPDTRDSSLVLASDGLAEDVFGSPAVRTWLAERWAVRCDASAMADSLRYRRQGSHDDRTALVLWPHRTEDV
ncbi:protein phosphatase 2C domain-containing protein [Streptomyces sp. NPDC003011]